MRKVVVHVLVIFLGLYVISAPVLAAGNIHMGTLEIHPFASVNQTYNDNIYQEPKNRENGDQITNYQAGLLLSRPIKPGRDFIFRTKYYADFLRYHRYDKEDRTDHTVDALIDCTFANHLVLRLKEKFKKTAEPPNTELTDMEKRLRSSSVATLGLKGERLGIEVSYQYIRDNYDKLNYIDRKENIITPAIYLNISPKTSLLVEFDSGKIKYDKKNSASPDSDYTQWRGGIKGTIAPKLTGMLKAGTKETDYEDTRTFTERDFKGSTFFGNLKYQMKQRSTLNIYGNRSVVESTFETNNYFRATKGGGQLDHQLFKRIFIFGGGFYQVNKYPEEVTYSSLTDKRRDILQGANSGLRYEIQDWLIIEGAYTHKKKDSNFNDFDYKSNIYSGKLSLMF